MGIYDNSANAGKEILFNFIRERMKEKNLEHIELAKLIDINDSTLRRNLNNENEMSLSTLFKVLGALEIRPFFIPAEIDQTEYQRMFFS